MMQWELIRAQNCACAAFFDKYFDDRGYLQCVPRWGGNDGADDAIENLVHWPILYVLGGSPQLMSMCKRAWEGHLQQYTEAKTRDVPFAREGMYYKEFPVMFDWLHNGEGLTTFNLHGLMDPDEPNLEMRTRRYAGLYMDEDPQAPNYDPQHKIIRSLFNGSRGPLMRKATAVDWAGDQLEQVEGRFIANHGERNYEQMLAHFEDYTDIVGDHAQNLVATSLGFNAFALTGDQKYQNWVLEYVQAWRQRTLDNGGIIPTNIGLDGSIGGECGGKWYGGTYGWGFTVTVPQTGELSHRNSHYLAISGFGNAILLTGEQQFVDVWRQMIDTVNGNAKEIDGQLRYPHMYGDEGWYDYTPHPYEHGALEVYYWSMDRKDLGRVRDDGWINFLEGTNPDYPLQALSSDFEYVRQRMQKMRNDLTTPDTRLSDNPNHINPAAPGALLNLMMGGLTPRHGCPLHCRVRYFDPRGRRPGLPGQVGALVEALNADGMTLTLVNMDPVQPRELIVQGGAYAEHEFQRVQVNGLEVDVDGAAFGVRLEPGCGSQLKIKMRRYVNPPTFVFPWRRGLG